MIAKLLRALVPVRLEWAVKRVLYRGRRRHCPVCGGRVRRFQPHGVKARPDARCPVCKSVERHRMVWLLFERRSNLLDGTKKRMLHIAPEKCFAPRLAKTPGLDYLTADLMDPSAMVQMDVCDIPYPKASFDVIYCSHVLEHVPGDRKAMREFRRVLSPDGWALFLVPIAGATTDEDPDLKDPAERARRFGQPDHVRMYGADFADRLAESGFAVERVQADAFVTPAELDSMRINCQEDAYLCRPDSY